MCVRVRESYAVKFHFAKTIKRQLNVFYQRARLSFKRFQLDKGSRVQGVDGLGELEQPQKGQHNEPANRFNRLKE